MLADLARGNEPVSAKDQLASQQQNQKGQTFAEYAERTIDKLQLSGCGRMPGKKQCG